MVSSFTSAPRSGFYYFAQGWKLVSQPGIRRFVILPLLVNILLMGGAFWWLFTQLDVWIDLLQLDNAGVVDIGGGTTGIAIVKKGKVTYSADEATGGHHISLTLAGNRRISLEEAEQYKRGHGEEIWPAVKPVYEKMADIVARHIEGQGITDLWLAGGSCMQPGVAELFRKQFPALQVHLPQHSLFMTPLAIASSGREKAEGLYAK